jgi:uncharacterized protein YoxC
MSVADLNLKSRFFTANWQKKHKKNNKNSSQLIASKTIINKKLNDGFYLN